jgi:hypothetical protein
VSVFAALARLRSRRILSEPATQLIAKGALALGEGQVHD